MLEGLGIYSAIEVLETLHILLRANSIITIGSERQSHNILESIYEGFYFHRNISNARVIFIDECGYDPLNILLHSG